MKYYEYISETKIGMLYEQIKPSSRNNKESLFEASLGVVKGSIKEVKQANSIESEIDKIPYIDEYLDRCGLIGEVGEAKTYIKGRLSLKYIINNCPEGRNNIALWVGDHNHIRVALVGSLDSLIGAPKNVNSIHNHNFYRISLIEAVRESEVFHFENSVGFSTIEDSKYAVDHWFNNPRKFVPVMYQEYEFIAKVILSDDEFILATPLYIAE